MPTLLLFSLTQIENALQKELAAQNLPPCTVTRLVNYHQRVARITLTPPPEADPSLRAGSIFLQTFSLADGSMCIKASLAWRGSEAFPAFPLYGAPDRNWSAEYALIAARWLAGPPPDFLEATRLEPLPSLAELAG